LRECDLAPDLPDRVPPGFLDGNGDEQIADICFTAFFFFDVLQIAPLYYTSRKQAGSSLSPSKKTPQVLVQEWGGWSQLTSILSFVEGFFYIFLSVFFLQGGL
jgi:hypothetical protein